MAIYRDNRRLLTAKTGHWGCWRNFLSLSSANGSFWASNFTFSFARPGQNRTLRMLAKFFIPKSSEWQLFGKQPCFLFCSTRPLTAGREWRLCGDEYSGQCVINSDGVIVMSTVLAFWHPWKPLKSRHTVLISRQKVSNCLAAKQQKLSSFWIPCKIVKRTHQKQQVT